MELFFEFEKLDVYQLALDYQLIADALASTESHAAKDSKAHHI